MANDMHSDMDNEIQPEHQYPDPVRASDHPYPALSSSIYGTFPGPAQPSSAYFTGSSFGNLVNDPLAQQLRLAYNQIPVQNWHLETGEQLEFEGEDDEDEDDDDDIDDSSTGSQEVEGLDWRVQARIARERQDAEDADFQPDEDMPVDTIIEDQEDDEEDDDGTNSEGDEGEEEELAQASSSRGRGRGRGGRKRGRGGTTRRGWRQLLKGSGFENIGRAEKAQRGRPRGSGGPHRGRARKKVDPGYRFKELLKLATQSHLAGQLERAVDHCRLAIQTNPEMFEAHSLLSEILRQQGKLADSVMALHMGAYTVRKVSMWILVADRLLETTGEEAKKTNLPALNGEPEDLRSPEEKILRTAVECFTEALKLKGQLDQDLELEIRERRLMLYKELGDDRLSRAECRSILRLQPDDFDICQEYAQLCATLDDKTECMRVVVAYDIAWEKHQDDDIDADPDFYWNHVNVYLEVFDMVGNPAEGIRKLKHFARWILGRKNETFWDRFADDDREFDDDDVRRNLVPEWNSGVSNHDKLKYGKGLPIELRVRLGIFRIRMGGQHYEEGVRHLDPLSEHLDQVEDYHSLIIQVAAALRKSGGRNAISLSLKFYDALRAVPEVIDEQTWTFMADCFRHLGKRTDAMACYEEAVAFRGKCFAMASINLAKLYEATGEKEKARQLCTQVIKLGRGDLLDDDQLKMFPESQRARLGHRERNTRAVGLGGTRKRWRLADVDQDDEDMTGTGLISKRRRRRMPTGDDDDEGEDEDDGDDSEVVGVRRPRLKRSYVRRQRRTAQERLQQIQDANIRVKANYDMVKLHWPAMLRGDDEEAKELWIESAINMAEDFADMKVFFPERDRNVKLRAVEDGTYVKLPPRAYVPSQYEPPQDFHSIPFSEWHHIFSDLALVYAKRGEQDRCYKIIQDLLFSANVFYHSPQLDLANYGVAFCCAFTFNDCQYLIDLARKLIHKSDFAPSTFSLFSAVNRLTHSNGWFNAGPSQKFMLRMVKQQDFTALPGAALNKYDWSIHRPMLERRRKEIRETMNIPHEDGMPSLLDPTVLLSYGHMVAVANHSNSAIPYYLRVAALAPRSPCVHLSLATAWLQSAMKRQTDNRQFGVAQGVAFLSSYRDLRLADGTAASRQESEYNCGRFWHQLGLTHLSVGHYEEALRLSPRVREEWREAHPDRDEGEVEDFATEAAFALQGIFALAGNMKSARAIGEKWLVI